ncbi:MAG: hypothetical protein HQK50_17670 [Oligoflexia bacterium]|nr:hypothetical protein [Oligoflexia bacterium]
MKKTLGVIIISLSTSLFAFEISNSNSKEISDDNKSLSCSARYLDCEGTFVFYSIPDGNGYTYQFLADNGICYFAGGVCKNGNFVLTTLIPQDKKIIQQSRDNNWCTCNGYLD